MIGGYIAVPHSYPWQVSLRDARHNHFCGGSIIAERWILTAAHCRFRAEDGEYAVIGAHEISSGDQAASYSTGFRIEIEDSFTHEDFGKTEAGSLEWDFQLLKTKLPIDFANPHVEKICSPDFADTFERRNCIVTGWGANQLDTEKMANYLMQARLPTWSVLGCENKWGPRRINQHMLCAGNEFSGACNGDSGGPLVCQDEVTGSWQLAGVVSWGALGCDPSRGYPTIFARVSSALNWISNVMVGLTELAPDSRKSEEKLAQLPVLPRRELPTLPIP